MNISEAAKPVGDVLATTTLIAVLADIITALAGIFTVVWYAVRLYEKIEGKPFHETPLVLWWRNRGKK